MKIRVLLQFLVLLSLFPLVYFLLLHHRLQIITGEIKRNHPQQPYGNRILPYTLSVVMLDGHRPVFLYLNKHHKLGGSVIATNIGKEKLRSPLSDEDFLLNSLFPRYPPRYRYSEEYKKVGAARKQNLSNTMLLTDFQNFLYISYYIALPDNKGSR